jgi:broad specificity phosphatase PhoE
MAAALGIEPVHVEYGLRERDVGEWSGLTRAEIHREWPGYLADDPQVAMGRQGAATPRRPPNWEADDHVLRRVRQALSSINRLVPDGDVVAVTHGGVIYAVELNLGDVPGRLANLAGRWVEVEGDRLTLGERVALVPAEETVAIERDRI